jgi:small-conductance mechanosensitive channel
VEVWQQVKEFLNIPLFHFSNNEITLWTLAYLIVSLILLFIATGWLKHVVVNRLLSKSSIDIGVREAMASIVGYVIISVGVMILLQTTGLDLSALTILAGALGIGVGFGLQNITTNFISGLIILFERPIKVGDRIEVEQTAGDVTKISLRATTVITNDNIAVIVPNSQFVSSTVINWSHTDRDVRFNIPVGVSYNSDPERVRELLIEVAGGHPGVLKSPSSDVLFEEFGESSLNFILRVWTRKYITKPGVLKSELNFAISKVFRENGIEIPYPQRDIHIRNRPTGNNEKSEGDA